MIPPLVKESIDAWIATGRPTGSFLEAVLCNDLKGAFSRADMQNRYLLWDIVSYLYNDCPLECWGSPEAVREWGQARRAELQRGESL